MYAKLKIKIIWSEASKIKSIKFIMDTVQGVQHNINESIST